MIVRLANPWVSRQKTNEFLILAKLSREEVNFSSEFIEASSLLLRRRAEIDVVLVRAKIAGRDKLRR